MTTIANADEPFNVYDSTVSPWKVYCVQREDGGQTVVVFKFHHCLMDATGFSVFLSDLFQDEKLSGLRGSRRGKNRREELVSALKGYFNSGRWTIREVRSSKVMWFLVTNAPY
jgi:hypothetical protein